MSLLANLLAFSSINSSPEREERSNSTSSKFFGDDPNPYQEQSNKTRTTSKSLTKMNLFSSSSGTKIDPKHRCLHRISHSLSMKVRKHYYTFFVTLETMKKKNIRITQISPENIQKIKNGLGKLSQTMSIIQMKNFQNLQKPQIWNKIKQHSQQKKGCQIIDRVFYSQSAKISAVQLFEHMKKLDQLFIKVEILIAALEPFKNLSGMSEAFQKINEQVGQRDPAIHTPEKKYCSPQKTKNSQDFEKCPGSSSKKTPMKAARKTTNLRDSIKKDTIQGKSHQTMDKCYQVLLNFNEKPFQIKPSIQSLPLMLKKQIPHELALSQIGDIHDKSTIFRSLKSSNASEADKLEISNLVGESFSKVDAIICDLQKNKDKHESIKGRSDITYKPFLPFESCVSSITNKSQSNFGAEAVNFKNSLVHQRQSMKNNQKDKSLLFKKKFPKNLGQPGTPNFLKELKSLPNSAFDKPKIGNQFTEYYDKNRDYKEELGSLSYLMRSQDDSCLKMYEKASGFDNCPRSAKLDYRSEGKNPKSLSFNGHDLLPKKLRFGESQVSEIRELEGTPITSLTVTSLKSPQLWKNELLEKRRTQMLPVRDSSDPKPYSGTKDLSAFTSYKFKNQGECSNAKKFINLSKQ